MMRGFHIFGLLAALPCVAIAQSSQCAPRANVVAHLAEKYGETRQGMGLAGPETVMEMFASIDTGTWTITMTGADGITCMVGSGQSYEALNESPPPAGTDG